MFNDLAANPLDSNGHPIQTKVGRKLLRVTTVGEIARVLPGPASGAEPTARPRF